MGAYFTMEQRRFFSWNINSWRMRHEQVWRYLNEQPVDVLGVQELKQHHEALDASILDGWHHHFFGQKAYNGVGLISRYPLSDIQENLPNFPDNQARLLSATIENIRVINIYVPNGQAIGSDKYIYKLEWLKHFADYLKDELKRFPKIIILGDFNIMPKDIDVYSPEPESIYQSSAERSALQTILNLGFQDGFRYFYPDDKRFSFWDYRAGCFPKNQGMRIDFTLFSPELKPIQADIDPNPRGWDNPSDHTPVWLAVEK